MTRFWTTRFNLILAATQMLVGLILYFQPEPFLILSGNPGGELFRMDPITLVGGGVLLLIVERLKLSRLWQSVIGLIPAVPPALAAMASIPSGLQTSGAVFALISLAVVVGALAGGDRQRPAGIDLWMLALGAVQATCGAAFLFGGEGDLFLVYYTPLYPYVHLVGAIGLISGAALFLGSGPWKRPSWSPLYHAIGAIFPTLMAWTLWKAGAYAGMAAWSVWALGLLVSPSLFMAGQTDASEQVDADTFPVRLERMLEYWLWLLAFCVVVTMADDGGHSGGAIRSALFILALSTYNVIAFRIVRNVGSVKARLRCHLWFVTAAVALLLLHASPIGHGFLTLLACVPAVGARAGGKREGFRLMTLAGLGILASRLTGPPGHGGPTETAMELGMFTVSAAAGLFIAIEQRRSAAELALRQVMLEEALASTRRAEAEKARLAAVLEATPDVVIMYDPSWRAIYLNQAAQQMVDLVVGETAHDYLVRHDLVQLTDRLMKELLPALQRNGYWSGEDHLFVRSGELVPVSGVIMAHRSSGGEVLYYSLYLRDIRDQKRYEQQLLHLASYDPLTELFNRRRFLEELDQQLAMGSPGTAHGALIFIDVDQFKYVNDTLGHRAGDELLRNLAEVLRLQVRRETDTVARLGGDEFAVIVPGASEPEARTVAERILDQLSHNAHMVSGKPVACTVSIGIALYPDHGSTAADLLTRADVAMYQSKDHGRNRASFFNNGCAAVEQGEQKLHWEQRIRAAIDENRFVLYSQPIWSMAEGRISHCELLLRMLGENGEVIAPGEFLPVAERFGLIHAIDRLVVRKAIQTVAAKECCGVVEVNLSGLAFSDAELLPLIRRELAEHQVNPAAIIFEITETAAIADLQQAKQFISTLRTLGCRFAIDDFGSGFASFAYLKHLPVEFLKIDGSFVVNLMRDPVDRHLVKSMVEVARGLGKQTIAEFVGDAETMRLLRDIGVGFAQGYYIGVPAPVQSKTALPQ
ncbi:MAG: hypothetical protein K0R39_3556 [Symbiobacteriaceae bacterium]|jgi:diguanylate cyclase (GGDEF)-like protein/PAS domain S-box-containing protein|nr:hypothetical protein [Symbiobacteriaceae bacterium]